MECEANWRTLPLDSRIAKTYHIAGVSFRSKIMLFGGVSSASYNMYALSEEGELVDDLSEDPLIPGFMVRGCSLVQEGKIYAVGLRDLAREQWKWRIEIFDGSIDGLFFE